jgi:cystathionine beta-lyase
MPTDKPVKPDTLLTHAGSHPELNHGAVNPPIYRVSTVVFPTVAAMKEGEKHPFDHMRYGRQGTPTTFAFEEAVAALDGAAGALATCSGQAAITTTLGALLKAGDHALIADSVYHPTRRYCSEHLAHCGVEIEYYDPRIGAGIDALIKPNTKIIYTESPGSLSFEMQDIPAIAAAAHAKGALVVTDNTWATGLFFDAFKHGVDISVQAATKFLSGHSDAMLGVISCKEKEVWTRIKNYMSFAGMAAGSEEVYLGLRGMRTLAVRLRQHQASGLAVARWLQTRPEVARVIHPALPGSPCHDLWKRDFTGSCGLFGVELKPCPQEAVNALIDGLTHFGLGFSWGGFESLILPTTGAIHRTATSWKPVGPTLRLHIGLEDPDDLIVDLARGLDNLGTAMGG